MSFASKLFIKGCESGDAKKNAGQTTPSDIVRYDDIVYGSDKTWNVLDVYRPHDTEGPLPTIVSVHGGGWVYGDKDLYQWYCMELAQQGFAVVNFTYRLAPDHVFPSGMSDLDTVIRFVLSHADTYGFDTEHVFMVGDSAGAHMTSMYACACTNPVYSARLGIIPPKGFVPCALALNCGVYDMGALFKMKGALGALLRRLVKDLLGTKHPTGDQLDFLSPARYVTKDFPPAYVMSATGDFVRYQIDYLVPVLKERGVEHECRIYGTEEHQLGHVFHCDPRLEEAHACNREEMDFFKRFC